MNFYLVETWFQPISLSFSKIQNSSIQTINKFERQPLVNNSVNYKNSLFLLFFFLNDSKNTLLLPYFLKLYIAGER